MKYKVIEAFMPGVIVGQEIKLIPSDDPFGNSFKVLLKTRGTSFFCISYIEAHPEIFEEVVERWNPENAEEYYFVANEEGNTSNWVWDEDAFSDPKSYESRRYKTGNCFQTKDQAKEAFKRIKKTLLEYHEELNETK